MRIFSRGIYENIRARTSVLYSDIRDWLRCLIPIHQGVPRFDILNKRVLGIILGKHRTTWYDIGTFHGNQNTMVGRMDRHKFPPVTFKFNHLKGRLCYIVPAEYTMLESLLHAYVLPTQYAARRDKLSAVSPTSQQL
jgi:hypothetical protein